MPVVENVAAMRKLVPKVTICTQEGKQADDLDGKAREENVYALRYLFKGLESNDTSGLPRTLYLSGGVGGRGKPYAD